MKRALMIAYHYPPINVSSGVHRTLKFTQCLPQSGWEPVVLTIDPSCYQKTNQLRMKDIPEGLEVVRAFGLDVSKHLAIKGRYPGVMAIPDRWSFWWYGAVYSGMKMIRKYKPDIIW